ncbi:MAG: methyltransferase domain-containing protein [Rhodobacteraceae bacterium]|nr:methyltransferase domain-containing protein [Paracoccaceae bacterium]
MPNKVLLDLGELYVSDFLSDGDDDHIGRSKEPLKLILDEKIGAPRLTKTVDPDKMYGRYWYRSGTNASMTNQLREITEEVCSRIKHDSGDIWLDIACNDGTMFRFIPDHFIKLGIDPCDDSYLETSTSVANVVVQDFFSKTAYNKTGYGDKKCKVITTIAMFYDLDDPIEFINDVYNILDDDGVWVVQMSYTPLMLKQMAFDNICHEHVYYYSLTDIQRLMDSCGFKVVDCSLNDTNGGSFRVYLQKKNASEISFGTKPLRDVCKFRIDSLLHFELSDNKTQEEIWTNFGNNLNEMKDKTVEFIRQERAAGKKIYGYGASTKGNTLLQYYGLDHNDIIAIAERSPMKFGLKTVGTNIPIVSELEMRAANPDYLVVLPWHFIKEFVNRESDFLNSGGKFIVPCPEFKIIGKDGV